MKKSVIFLLVLIYSIRGFACTTFLLNDRGHYYFGRNYDWITGNGMVMTNVRNLNKTSAEPGSGLTWFSKYGSITFNQYGKEFPTGGMNEKGLVVELMWLDGSRYPPQDTRSAIGVLQWVQYQLDNCATIEEVIATDKKLRINGNETPLHYLVADSLGHAATIEFLEGKMVVHKGDHLKYPVLTNSTYEQSLQFYTSLTAPYQGAQAVIRDNSLRRFSDACTMISGFNPAKQNALDYSFSILNKVSQLNYTKWSIVYDITAKKICFITAENSDRRTISFVDFNFDCTAPSLARDLNQEGNGNISRELKKLEYETNKLLVETSAKQTSSIFDIPESEIKRTVDFFNKTSCRQSP